MNEPKAIHPLFTWRSAICDSQLAATTRHVANTLSFYMNERGASAFPGAERLAHDTGLTSRAVREHLGLLVEAGYLELVERGGRRGQRRHANHYRATIPLGITTPEPGSPVNMTTLTPEPRSPHLFKNSSCSLGEPPSGVHTFGPVLDPIATVPECPRCSLSLLACGCSP